MPIKSGIGIGEAQVYDTSALDANFVRLIQQKQKSDAQYADELATSLAKVDLNNLDPKDARFISDKYTALKDLYTKSTNLKKLSDRAIAKAQLAKGIDDINQYATGAKQWRKDITQVGVTMADPNNSDDYDDESKDEVKNLINSSYGDAIEKGRASITPFTYQRKPDLSLIPKEVEATRKDMEEAAKSQKNFYTAKTKEGYDVTGYQLPTQDAVKFMTARFLSNDKLKYQTKLAYKQANPNNPNPTDIDLANFFKAKYEERYPNNAYSFMNTPTKPVKEKSEGDVEPTASDYQVGPKKFFSPSSVEGAPVKPRVTADFDKFVTVKSSAFSPPQLENVYNIAKGKNEPMKANKDMKLTGLGYVIGAGGVRALRATVVDSDNREYMMQPKDLPVSIRKEKSYERALKALGTTPVASTPSKQVETVPSASRSEWIKAGWNNEQINQAVKAGKIKLK